MKKIIALIVALMIVMSMSALADDTGSITITLPTTQQAPTEDTTYSLYKIFNATVSDAGISYSLIDGKTAPPTGFILDDAGNVYLGTSSATATGADGEIATKVNGATTYIVPQTDDLTADQIANIAAYTEGMTPITVTASAGDATVTADNLEFGYYYISTTTGTAVTIDSTNPDAEVDDKNVIPKVVKSAGTQYDEASLKAIAAVGTSQPFTAQITKTHGAVNLVFSDTMTNMTYNEDVAITVSAGTAPTADQAKVELLTDGFKVTFDNTYIAGLADGTVITLNYSGTITSDALSADPATNKATLTSGNGNTSESEEVEVYNAKFTVTKKDGNGAALAGAGFVLKNSENKYYKLVDAAAADDPDTEDIDESVKHIEWVESIDDATEYTSDAQGAVTAFTGLKDGTYTLVEKTVPAGYNPAADSSFTVSGTDYTAANLEQTAEVVNNAGAVLPSTGGIGTTIFYIAGSILVLAAAVLLITKRRMGHND